jgi:integrase
MKTGMRTTELCTLRIEHIDFDTYHFQVLDSKKHAFCPYPLPLDIKTLELIKAFVGSRIEGFVFRQTQTWKYARADMPLSKQTVWTIIHNIGLAAGVEGLTPRHFREWFAAEWYYCTSERERDLPELQRFLRHKKPGTTLDYVNSMVFQENMDAAYRRRMDEVAGRFVGGCQKQKEMIKK